MYTYGIDNKSTFPRERYELLKKVLDMKNYNSINILQSHKADIKDIYRAHSNQYCDRFVRGELNEKEIRQIGLKPWSDKIIDRTLLITGGSLMALNDILNGARIAGNMAGGTHHAFYDKGSGFCIFNDIAICALKAQKYHKFKKILIIDLDVHQGDGTAKILENNKNTFTVSVHCEKNFPFKKAKSDLDINVKEDTGDSEYLSILSNCLKNLNSIESDIIFFQAGVDGLKNDRYGKLSLSLSGLKKRNNLIFEFSKKRNNPILIFMGGGYSEPIFQSVKAFEDLFLQASDY